MGNNLFNSRFEMKLRMLLLMSIMREKTISVDRIIALDFISCYATDFSLPYANLHGQNNFKFGEISNRRMLVQETIKTLVIQGLVTVTVGDGYFFSIADTGRKYINKLKSNYAVEYKTIAKAAVSKYKKKGDKDILVLIQNHSLKALKG